MEEIETKKGSLLRIKKLMKSAADMEKLSK
jgi:hypothetical protein